MSTEEPRRVLVENLRSGDRWEQEIVSTTPRIITTRDDRNNRFTWMASNGVCREHMLLRLVHPTTLAAR